MLGEPEASVGCDTGLGDEWREAVVAGSHGAEAGLSPGLSLHPVSARMFLVASGSGAIVSS